MNARFHCQPLFWVIFILTSLSAFNSPAETPSTPVPKVYILPIRDDIMPPILYVVRRGVKEAMEANADLLLLDMNTDGGRVDVTEDIIGILNRFKGKTATYVNTRAFSAGSFISVSTQKIYMSPQSVIGAAAPIMMSPGGGGIEKMPDTVEAKMTSAIRALVRTQAEKNGYNIDVIEAMIDKTKTLTIDGQVLNKEGEILTLTDRQAAKEYGDPPKPLLSSGTYDSIDDLLKALGYANAERIEIKPTGAEQLGTWINAISPLLLVIGIIGIYIEFKTPGFGLPGIIGIAAFVVYFLGGYVAGLSGAGWIIVFILGVALVLLELLVFPGTVILGILGGCVMLTALVMGMVDMYPGSPTLPTFPQLELPLRNISMAGIISLLIALGLARILPNTSYFQKLVSQSASGEMSLATLETQRSSLLGQSGVTLVSLRPGGKAKFNDELVDVITRGEMIAKDRPVRIIGFSGLDAIVEEIG